MVESGPVAVSVRRGARERARALEQPRMKIWGRSGFAPIALRYRFHYAGTQGERERKGADRLPPLRHIPRRAGRLPRMPRRADERASLPGSRNVLHRASFLTIG